MTAVTTDQELAARSLAGDVEAGAELFGRYYGLVRFVASQVHRDPDFVDEVSGDVWLQFVAGKWRLVPGVQRDSLSGFITITTRRAALRRRRDRFRRPEATANTIDDPERPVRLHAREPSIERRLIGRQLIGRVQDLVGQLPPLHRRLAIARFVEQESPAVIAEREGMRVKTVRQYLYLIRDAIRQGLEGYADLPSTPRPRRERDRIRLRDDSSSPRALAADRSPSAAARLSA